jgi:hypothetical protein
VAAGARAILRVLTAAALAIAATTATAVVNPSPVPATRLTAALGPTMALATVAVVLCMLVVVVFGFAAAWRRPSDMHWASLTAVPALVAVSILRGAGASGSAVEGTGAAVGGVLGGAFLVGAGGTACFCNRGKLSKHTCAVHTITQVSV